MTGRADLSLFCTRPASTIFASTPFCTALSAILVPSTPVFEMYPIGFTTMAEYLERHGLPRRILNLAVRMLDDHGSTRKHSSRLCRPAAFGIDLHWLPHAHGALAVAEIAKRYHPDIPIIFGGFSATYLP